MKPEIRFNEVEIHEIASQYEYSNSKIELIDLKAKVNSRDYLTKDELKKIAYGKRIKSDKS